MNIILTVILALILDLCLGDPRWLLHPVTIIAKMAHFFERITRKIKPDQPFICGLITATLVILVTGCTTWLLIFMASMVHPTLGTLIEILVLYSCFATRGLATHSKNVYKALSDGDLELARKKVAMIVGRDTKALDKNEITRATIESVGENLVDGVTAPIFYAILFGPIGVMVYKAINTLDSSFGYKNEKYRQFGYVSAKVDDLVNWVPARLTGPIISLSAIFCGLSARLSLRIFLRDRFKHNSPNSAHGEAAFAGALGVQLGGPTEYQGKIKNNPHIGDALDPLQPKHIIKANRLMYVTSFVFVIILILIREMCRIGLPSLNGVVC